jgi:DNA repair exonuclease SbcCD ATPase subunit
VTESHGEEGGGLDTNVLDEKNVSESPHAATSAGISAAGGGDDTEAGCLRNELTKAKHDYESSQDMLRTLQHQILTNQRSAAGEVVMDEGDEEDTDTFQTQLLATRALVQNNKLLELLQDKLRRCEEQAGGHKKELKDVRTASEEQKKALAATREELDRSNQVLQSPREELARYRPPDMKVKRSHDDDVVESFARKRVRADLEADEGDSFEGAEIVEAEIVVFEKESIAKKRKNSALDGEEEEV